MQIVLNVRPSHQAKLLYARIHRPEMELALSALETEVLLYAPRDEARHGYFGLATVKDLDWDIFDTRFLVITIENVVQFESSVSISAVQKHLSQDEFAETIPHHYARGIRAISIEQFQQIIELGLPESLVQPRGMAELTQTNYENEPSEERHRRHRELVVRSQRLRLDVLYQHGFRCSVTGLRLSPLNGLKHEMEVCHIKSVEFGGPDEVRNAFPAIRSAHWAFDFGLFTIRPNRRILFSADAPPDLKWLFRGNTHARFPNDVDAWPKKEYLDFHYSEVFNKRGR